MCARVHVCVICVSHVPVQSVFHTSYHPFIGVLSVLVQTKHLQAYLIVGRRRYPSTSRPSRPRQTPRKGASVHPSSQCSRLPGRFSYGEYRNPLIIHTSPYQSSDNDIFVNPLIIHAATGTPHEYAYCECCG